ncbi:ABC transporter ATP-binding protein [Luteococcus sp. OSA5]|uniref:ABC transporter ATP-binding protein n=1 Tax=Luteococcus sp. OSA5 TaxID=3401630 RepID=UPI003B436E8C
MEQAQLSRVLQARGLTRRIGERTIIEGVDVDVFAGQSLCVVGPSGSGKSTLLRALAGLDELHAGQILLDGQDVTRRPPHQRGVAMVFQDADLFGDLDVAENIGFGLGLRGPETSRHDERVQVTMLRLGLAGLERRLPHQLSGGQRRRVSLARALVSRPRVLLLDEPMAALEDRMRLDFTRQLRRVRQRTGTAMVHVTHDQSEALGSGDRLLVLSRGKVLQQGTPQQVHARPVTAEVAALLGRSNFLEVGVEELRGGQGAVRARVRALGVCGWVDAHDALLDRPQRARLLVRPHALSVESRQLRSAARAWRTDEVYDDVGLLQQEIFQGDHLLHVVETERGTVAVRSPLGKPLEEGRTVRLQLDLDECWLLPADDVLR